MNWDKEHKLLFAPLNGETFVSLLNRRSAMDTVMFYSGGKMFVKSDAMIEVLRMLGGFGKLAILLKGIPLFIRNWAYDFIAGQRRNVSCVILVKDERFKL
jgi:predicted DCC family thiol-disulfide oxidoreductase YuxK